MEKKVLRKNIDFYFSWTYGVSIGKLREDLDELEKLGADEVIIELDSYGGSNSISIEAFGERLETDEECKLRIDRENKCEEQIKNEELAELERLKLKYNQ